MMSLVYTGIMEIKPIIKKYRWRLALTLVLVLTETVLGVFFPLFIGKSIEGVMQNNYTQLVMLAVLGLMIIVIGGGRRWFDTRLYAKIYTQLSLNTVKQMPDADNSVKTARINMLSEMVEFAEDQLPDIVAHTAGLLGVLIILATLHIKIFIVALVAGFLILIVYALSGNKTIKSNTAYNNELEAQVNAISSKRQSELKRHLLNLMRWNIKLSDIETINYSISWLVMSILLVFSIAVSVTSDTPQYGVLFALIMYVYQYIESMVSLPLYYQQWLRLKEIYGRVRAF